MKLSELLMTVKMPQIAFEGEDEGGTGGSGGEDQDTGIATGGDGGTGGDADDDTDGGKQPAAVIDGGTAEGDDNSDEGDGDDDKSGEGDDDDDDDEDGEGDVPEAYDFTAIMPEGMEVDETMVEAVTPALRDLGLNQEQANKLVGAYAEAMQAQAVAAAEQVEAMMTGWVETAQKDKEIGHNNWDQTVKDANAVVRKFGTPELVQDVLVGQGMGNHPEVIRLLARIAKSVSDDVLDTGKATDTSESVPTENRWYGDTTPTSKKG